MGSAPVMAKTTTTNPKGLRYEFVLDYDKAFAHVNLIFGSPEALVAYVTQQLKAQADDLGVELTATVVKKANQKVRPL